MSMNVIRIRGYDAPQIEQLEISIKALREILRLYERSNKKGAHTLMVSANVAKSAIEEIEQIQRVIDVARQDPEAS